MKGNTMRDDSDGKTTAFLFGLVVGIIGCLFTGLAAYNSGRTTGERIGQLSVMAGQGCSTDYECELVADGENV
jgi:hypothetical protein